MSDVGFIGQRDVGGRLDQIANFTLDTGRATARLTVGIVAKSTE